jgi:hypothetical protein
MVGVTKLIFKVLKVMTDLGFDDIFVVCSNPLIIVDLSLFLLKLNFFLPGQPLQFLFEHFFFHVKPKLCVFLDRLNFLFLQGYRQFRQQS